MDIHILVVSGNVKKETLVFSLISNKHQMKSFQDVLQDAIGLCDWPKKKQGKGKGKKKRL